jgi:hypothetical protein
MCIFVWFVLLLLPPGENPFAVQVINNNNKNNNNSFPAGKNAPA